MDSPSQDLLKNFDVSKKIDFGELTIDFSKPLVFFLSLIHPFPQIHGLFVFFSCVLTQPNREKEHLVLCTKEHAEEMMWPSRSLTQKAQRLIQTHTKVGAYLWSSLTFFSLQFDKDALMKEIDIMTRSPNPHAVMLMGACVDKEEKIWIGSLSLLFHSSSPSF